MIGQQALITLLASAVRWGLQPPKIARLAEAAEDCMTGGGGVHCFEVSWRLTSHQKTAAIAVALPSSSRYHA
jgi:hypothetical protein